jgi:hypothetical protein
MQLRKLKIINNVTRFYYFRIVTKIATMSNASEQNVEKLQVPPDIFPSSNAYEVYTPSGMMATFEAKKQRAIQRTTTLSLNLNSIQDPIFIMNVMCGTYSLQNISYLCSADKRKESSEVDACNIYHCFR